MELSTRYRLNLAHPGLILTGVLVGCFGIFCEIEYVLSQGVLMIENAMVSFLLAGMFMVQAIVIFFAMVCLVAFLYSGIQQLLKIEWGKTTERFSLNALSYRLFYAYASRTNVFAFGFLIGLVLQGKCLIEKVGNENEWGTLLWAVGSLLQGVLIQFFIQSTLITLHYVLVYQIRKKYHRQAHVKRFKQQLNLLREQALHPMNLVLSFVVTPFVFFIGLLLLNLCVLI